MRKPRSEPLASLRTPVAVIARSAAHLDLASLSRSQRWRLLRRSVVPNQVIARGLNAGLETGLAQLLHLPRDEARAIALRLATRDAMLRLALQTRLAYLGSHGTAGQTRSFLRLIPRVDEQISSAFAPLLSTHPELRPWIARAKARFLQNPKSVLDHITGAISDSDVQLKGGGHELAIFETLADKQLSK
jgi:hypothetical protein